LAPELVTCPVCKQRLAIQEYIAVGGTLVCANCETNLRIERRRPLRVAVVPVEATFNSDSRPESYG